MLHKWACAVTMLFKGQLYTGKSQFYYLHKSATLAHICYLPHFLHRFHNSSEPRVKEFKSWEMALIYTWLLCNSFFVMLEPEAK